MIGENTLKKKPRKKRIVHKNNKKYPAGNPITTVHINYARKLVPKEVVVRIRRCETIEEWKDQLQAAIANFPMEKYKQEKRNLGKLYLKQSGLDIDKY